MIRRFLDALYRACGILSAACLGLIGALVLAQIVCRQLGILIPSADDFAGYSMAASAFLGLAYAFRRGAHIRVTLIIGRQPPRSRRLFELACLTTAATALVFLAWYLAALAWESYVFDDRAMGLIPTPLWIPQSVIAVGAVVMAIACIDELVTTLTGGEPRYLQADAAPAPTDGGQR